MTGAPDRGGMIPAAGAGMALLVFGALLLVSADALAPQDPSALALWVVGVGVIILLGALLWTLLRTSPHGSPAAPSSGSVDRTDAPSSEPVVAKGAPRVEESEEVWADPRERRSTASSIPAQYVRLLPDDVSWAEVPRPVTWDDPDGISLPFSAGPRGVGSELGGLPGRPDAPAPSVTELEFEVERLRGRVQELEAIDVASPYVAPVPVRPSLFVLGAPSEVPRPGSSAIRRACVGCGSGLSGSATDPLCWGCGRPLCATCYWRTKEGAGAHTCPSCFARTDGTSRSGARGPAPVTRPATSSPSSATATAPR